MPALVLFGYRTLVAGDDLHVYSVLGILIRLTQLGIGMTLVLETTRAKLFVDSTSLSLHKDCMNNTETDALIASNFIYLSLAMTVAILGAVLECAVYILSGRGTPTEPEKRARIRPICHFNLTVLLVLRLIMVVLGVYFIHTFTSFCACTDLNIPVCSSDHFGRTYLALTVSLFVDLSFNLLSYLYFGCKIIPEGIDSESRWRIFCRCCCTLSRVLTCCIVGGHEASSGDFTDVSILLSDFFNFHGTLDLAPSDVVAGLLVVQQIQHERLKECRKKLFAEAKEFQANQTENSEQNEVDRETNRFHAAELVNTLKTSTDGLVNRLRRHEDNKYYSEMIPSRLLARGVDEDVVSIAEGAHFMRLSLAIYTWTMYVYYNPYKGLCELSYLSGKSVISNGKRFTGDGKLCRLHGVAFLRQAGIQESEIAFAQFRSGVKLTPYAIVLDHDWKSIVIVIRGTGSLDDVLTDLNVRPTCLEELGKEYGFDGTERYAQKGMLCSSEWILNDIDEKGVLEKLASKDGKFAEYTIRVTGHSLGAGCAAIVSIFLRPKYPSILCHSFSPPGCTLSLNAAKECEDFLTSYILDSDIIPRSCLESLENLRHDVVDVITRMKVPKSNAIGCCRPRSLSEDADLECAELLYPENDAPDSAFKTSWERYQELYSKRKIERDFPDVPLFPPGRIVHLLKSSDVSRTSLGRRSKSNEANYIARWAVREDFREIRISNTFMKDHDAKQVLERLEDETERLGLEPHVYHPRSKDSRVKCEGGGAWYKPSMHDKKY